jgi:hypothetical protein
MLLAAFRLPDGTIKITGRNHDLNALPAKYRGNPGSVEDGFVTTGGRFLTRIQAAGIPRGAPTAELEVEDEPLAPSVKRQALADFGLDFDALLTKVRLTVPEQPETIYFVGQDEPTEAEIQGWISSLLAEGRIEEGAYSVCWVTLSSGVRKPAGGSAQPVKPEAGINVIPPVLTGW